MKRLANPCTCGLLHVWTDGQPFAGTNGARWDSYATVVIDNGGGSLTPGMLYAYKGIGDKTSNEAEYSAVILALEWAKTNREKVHVITDSDVILGQVFRSDRCVWHLQPYRDRVVELLRETGAKLEWQGRDYNKAGWYNAGILMKRRKARTKERERERKAALRETPKPRRWDYQTREEDNGVRYVS